MKDNYKEPKLTYALDSSGKMVHISSVERGLSCNCRCPKCNEFLVAKLGHEGGRQAHFAHRIGSDCHGSYMSALHKLAEQIIEEEMAVMVPAYKEIDKQRLKFEKVEVEQRVERKDLQPDIVGVTSNGLRWFIEIRNTHEVDEAKKSKLIESEITCLEIDVRDQTLDNLKSFLLESTENREWINNPYYEAQIAEAKRKIVSQVESLLLNSKELTIPKYAGIDTPIINIKEVSTLLKSEDGLYLRLKVLSSDDTTYIFEVGSHCIIDASNIALEHDCNELKILTDDLPHDSVIALDDLNIKWAYHLATEKELEARIKEYISNPQYEVRPKADCYSKCKYRPFLGKCIYSKAIITQNNKDYVVCKKGQREKDETKVPSRNNISDSDLSSNTGFQRFEDGHQENNLREGYNTNVSSIKTKQAEVLVHSSNTTLQDTLPFDRFWTLKEFYTQLQSSNSYEIEEGLLVEIVKCDRTNSGILLLYRDSSEVRTYCPFHIAIINVRNGNLVRNKVADFTNKKGATDSYYKRLIGMRDSAYMTSDEENDDDNLPF